MYGYLTNTHFVSAFQNVERQIVTSLLHFCSFRAVALSVPVPEYLFKDVCTEEARLPPKRRADVLTAHNEGCRFSWFKVLLPLWLLPLL